jgi:hypothetical protein
MLDKPAVTTRASRGSGRCTNSKLAILTFTILAATVVRVFTNPRFGKIKFVNVVADCAQ